MADPIMGIAVGCSIGVPVLLVTLFLLIARRKRSARLLQENEEYKRRSHTVRRVIMEQKMVDDQYYEQSPRPAFTRGKSAFDNGSAMTLASIPERAESPRLHSFDCKKAPSSPSSPRNGTSLSEGTMLTDGVDSIKSHESTPITPGSRSTTSDDRTACSPLVRTPSTASYQTGRSSLDDIPESVSLPVLGEPIHHLRLPESDTGLRIQMLQKPT